MVCLFLEKTRVLKGSDHFYHLTLWEILSGARAPAGVLCPMRTWLTGGKQRHYPSLPHAASWPESRRGRKGPISFSLAQLDPERQRWILKVNAAEILLRLNMSHCYQLFPDTHLPGEIRTGD